jgi:hypothetical protein
MSDDITSEHMRVRQEEEQTTAEHATLPAEEQKARRRADKAAYLRAKLEEQERADDGS